MRDVKINGLKKPILLSVLVHLSLVIFFSRFAWNIVSSRPETVITLELPNGFIEQTPEPEPAGVKKRPLPRQTLQPEAVALPRVVKPLERAPVALDSTGADSTKEFNPRQFFSASPFVAFKKPLDSLIEDSAAIGGILTPSMSLRPLDSFMAKATPGPYDPVQQTIDKQNRGGVQLLPLGQALNQGARYLASLRSKKKAEKPVRFDSVPSEADIQVFRVLWSKPQARDHEIYAAMDSSIKLTAVDLNRVLTRLTEKGMLKRKMVSPQNEFTLPLGTVEMSAKNRRNRVYEYETRVKPQELLVFLQAVLYETEHRKNAAGEMNQKAIADLRQKILKVASGTAKD